MPGPQGPPGGTLDVPFLKSVSWDLAGRSSPDELASIAKQMVLTWTAEITADRFVPFTRAAVQVLSAPRHEEFPVRAVPHRVRVAGNDLAILLDTSHRGLSDLMEVGGELVVDVVCDYLVDDKGLPFSSSLGPLLTGQVDGRPAGGLLRLVVAVG